MSCNKKMKGGHGGGFGLGLGVGVLGAAVVGSAIANSRNRSPCPSGQGLDASGRCRDFAGGKSKKMYGGEFSGGKILNFKEFSDAYLAGGKERTINDAVLFEAFAMQK